MSRKGTRTSALCYRIILFANLMALIAYGATTPKQLYKVTSECVAIGVAGFSMFVQAYITWAVYACCLPYNIWLTIILDAVCEAGWVATIAVLSYWDRQVVYTPRSGDPTAWLQCADAKYWSDIITDDGPGHWVNLVWCEAEVGGKRRLVGNGAARQQLHVLVGLSAVALLFTGLILHWTVRRGREDGEIGKEEWYEAPTGSLTELQQVAVTKNGSSAPSEYMEVAGESSVRLKERTEHA
ncbi:hypothetical protein BJY04DRAFT_202149 [Aspergillus karnatakaensis]|uniref:uncharacterized protein n=1 Tax=Aspergillus karnatakaensis TaxID=1810916 RepID=UPI003CCCE8EE